MPRYLNLFDISATTSRHPLAFQDFAGSGALHSLSGAAALIGAFVVGPRIGRFDPDTGEANHIKGHSVPVSMNRLPFW